MRFVIDLDWTAADHVEGTVAWTDADKAVPVMFSGWLDLLRLLEREGKDNGRH